MRRAPTGWPVRDATRRLGAPQRHGERRERSALNELLVDEALSLSTCTSTPGAGETYIRFLRFDSVALSINRQAPPRRRTPPSQRCTDCSFTASSEQRLREIGRGDRWGRTGYRKDLAVDGSLRLQRLSDVGNWTTGDRVMADPENIYNWRRLDDWITTSGQPTETQLADFHALGVRKHRQSRTPHARESSPG